VPTTHIVTHSLIQRRPAEVFDYVTTPANWPKWHPSSVAVRGPGADHSSLVGEEITEDFRVAGRSGTVTWRVIESIEPSSWAIEGVIQGRSNGGVVRYELAPTETGTSFTRTFSYPTPGALFTFLDRLFVRRRVRRESADAVRRLRKLLESR
jgi:uncharacterized protein YndB with AHSA1/START domain